MNGKKYKKIISFMPAFTSFILIIFLITSCRVLPGGAGEWFKKILGGSDIFKSMEEEKPDKKAAGESQGQQQDKGSVVVLPPIQVYVDSVIDYSSHIMITDVVNKSIAAYNSIAFYRPDGSRNKIYEGYSLVYGPEEADIIFKIVTGNEMEMSLGEPLYYVPVTSFYSLVEDISFGGLKDYWSGKDISFPDIEGSPAIMELAIESSMFGIMEKILGNCKARSFHILNGSEIRDALQSGTTKTGKGNKQEDEAGSIQTDETSLPETGETSTFNPGETDAWLQEKQAQGEQEGNTQVISIIPFDRIEPYHKVIKIDGKNLLDKNYSGEDYPLRFAIGADYINPGIEDGLKHIIRNNFRGRLLSNRYTGDIVSIIMTGVTALTRQVAGKMDQNGILYPAEKILDVLLDADITHISDEVSFVPDCYAAKPNTMVFCSRPEYMELLKHIDVDVIELTGNHINDYGSKWLDYSIDIFDKEAIPYFGGGRNIEDAEKPAVFEINGYKFAFIGANPVGPSYAWAADSSAGSAPINSLSEELKEADMQKYEEKIRLLKSQGYIVIFTFQYFEAYSYSPTPKQVEDFERMINSGADIVSGSQAHQPQGFKISDSGFINFGLGNLFFGQDGRSFGKELEVKQGIVAKHIFYKGSHINTELITTYIEDFSQPRLMTMEERADLLESVFKGSVK